MTHHSPALLVWWQPTYDVEEQTMFRTDPRPDLSRLERQIDEDKRRLHERLNSLIGGPDPRRSTGRLHWVFFAAFGAEPPGGDAE